MVTLDADFHALLAVSGARRPSVVRLRVQGLQGPAAAQLIVRVIAACEVQLDLGAVASFDGRQARVRRLPLGRSTRKATGRGARRRAP